MPRTSLPALALLLIQSCFGHADTLDEKIRPFLKAYCHSCHQQSMAKGELDLTKYEQDQAILADFRRWNHIIEFIRDGEMPPEKAKQPPLEERKKVVDAIESILLKEARKHAGDPGRVLPRRLTRTEYEHSVRDLTGVTIRATQGFPTDPAAGEGFNNTGEALSMSPSLLQKYLAAAQRVSNHLLLKTSGITFAPFPVTSYNERKKLTEQAIIDFYQRHEVNLRSYLDAAWRYKHLAARPTLKEWAAKHGLSSKYLARVSKLLDGASNEEGYLKQLGRRWNALPAPGSKNAQRKFAEMLTELDATRRLLNAPAERLIRPGAGNWPIGHLDLRARVARGRDQFDPARFTSQVLVRFPRIPKPGRGFRRDADKPLRLFLRLAAAAGEFKPQYVILEPWFSKSDQLPRNEKDREKQQVVSLREVLDKHSLPQATRLRFGVHPLGDQVDANFLVSSTPQLLEFEIPAAALDELEGKNLLIAVKLDPRRSQDNGVVATHSVDQPPASTELQPTSLLLLSPNSKVAEQWADSAAKFCAVFPNRFFYVDAKRGLAAGFHLVEGFFRDDQPLVKLLLNKEEVAEINQLWEELQFVTGSAEVLIRGFVWFERSERHVLHDKRFDFLRPEDPALTTNAMLNRFERIYLEKMGIKLKPDSLQPDKPHPKYAMIHGFFEQTRRDLKRKRDLLPVAAERGIRDLLGFAERAYKRSLRKEEMTALRQLYTRLRKQGQSEEDALRGLCTAILMSPEFCYHYVASPNAKVAPLTPRSLAARLSYFLWSSLPDHELQVTADSGTLVTEKELLNQTRRMLKDPRMESFAREFFGQWLRYRDYLDKDPIQRDAFPAYTDELREAMFEEPTRLATDLILNDRPITDLLDSDQTWLNETLAKHYGGELLRKYRSSKAQSDWRLVDGLTEAGRGGILGMGVILTKNSSGERTSPVKRGFWTVHHLLGQHFPPPPADVPELPTNEREAKATIRELMARHTADANCAICHKHFDNLGLSMEGFDPIGRRRTKDLGGRKINVKTQLPDGRVSQGVPDLIRYINDNRKKDFVRTFCRKFVGYALGRSVILSDQPLLEAMERELEENDYRFSVAFEMIVKSSQFRQQRGE